MGLVLWIDQNTFATSLIERAFKKKSQPFYTLASVDDFAYIVEDLSPSLIVLDGETYDKNPASFLKQYEGSVKMQDLPFIILEPKSDFGFIKKKIGELKKPLDPFRLADQLTAILSRVYN